MDNIANIPYSTVEFDQAGQRLRAPVLPGVVRDVIVVSHGWNNNRQAAETLYRTLFENFAQVHKRGTEKLAIIGVIWPSKKFDLSNDEPSDDDGEVRATKANGGNDMEEQSGADALFSRFEAAFADSENRQELATLRGLLGRLDSSQSQAEFIFGLQRLVAMNADRSESDGSRKFFESKTPDALFRYASQASAEVDGVVFDDGDEIRGVGFHDVFGSVGNAVTSLLNITTYYEMKKRAGMIGDRGLAPLIDELAEHPGVERIFLVGHSFGARLVTAAAMHSHTAKLHGMFLLQAAFSHNAFSGKGHFRRVVNPTRRIVGPIVITHTPNDRAVGRSYAIASRISGDDAADVGDATDKYGGLGCNGALNMADDEVSGTCRELLADGIPYSFTNGMVHNLESSRYIRDHGDVKGRQVAWAISQAIVPT